MFTQPKVCPNAECGAAEYLYKAESPVPRGLAPMFYHSLSYEGDVELVEKTKKARAALGEK